MIPATGVRIGWADLPAHVRAAVETMLGSPVTAARSQAGGFSPGTADRVETAAGGRAFVKAVGFTGFFLDISRQPPPPGIPTVRAFQRAQRDALLPWLRARMTV